jgi:hypothetical protein
MGLSALLHRRPTWLLVLIAVALFVCVYEYYTLLCDHGTFSLASLLVTYAYSSPQKAPVPVPRVVISMTTMPGNLGSLNDTLHSLMKLAPVRPDAIYVNVPTVNRRTGEAYPPPPAWLEHGFPGVIINRIETDWGPITKLVGCLDRERAPDTLIVTVDDDKTYPPHFLAKLVHHAALDPTVAWGICGWGFMPFPPPQRVIPAYLPYIARGMHGRGVQVLQGVCGAAYRRSFFEDLATLQRPAAPCFTADDMWISAYLSSRGVRRILTPGKPWAHFTDEPSTTPWMLHNERKHALSDINTLYGKDHACMVAAAEQLDAWRVD